MPSWLLDDMAVEWQADRIKVRSPSIAFQCMPNAKGPYQGFSLFYLSSFTYVVPMGSLQGTEITCQHAIQALHCTKASLCKDEANFAAINAEPDPGKCEHLGLACQNDSESRWLKVIENVLLEIVCV